MKYFLVFALVWWLVLFIVLPIGIKHSKNKEIKGLDSGAPINPEISKKFILTTLVASILLLVFAYLDRHDYITKFFTETL